MKELIKKLIPAPMRRKILEAINKLWVAFCHLFPVRRRVFFYSIRSDKKLLSNAKVLYDALDCKKKVFARKLPHSVFQKPRIYFYLLTSRVIVIDDYCRYMRVVKLRKGQKLFQIWHGSGAYKCFGLDAPSKLTKAEEKKTHSQYTAVAVTSEMARKYFAHAFGIKKEVCLPVGIPKADELINNADGLRIEFYKKHPELEGKTIYAYCPTFREFKGKVYDFVPPIDWYDLDYSLFDNEVFVVKRHPIVKNSFFDEKFSRVIDIDDVDIIELVAASSVLITDYSSVCHDATLLNVPCVFYCPDYKTYERDLYIKIPDDLPGELVTKARFLLDMVRHTKARPPLDRMAKFREEQLGACDGYSTMRIVSIIRGWLK